MLLNGLVDEDDGVSRRRISVEQKGSRIPRRRCLLGHLEKEQERVSFSRQGLRVPAGTRNDVRRRGGTGRRVEGREWRNAAARANEQLQLDVLTITLSRSTMVEEKVSNSGELPLPQAQQQAKVYPCYQAKGWRARLVATSVCTLLFLWMDYRSPFIFSWSTSSAPSSSSSSALAVCKQYPAWSPPDDVSLPALLPSSTYAQLLSGAVRIDTTVPDTWGPLDSPNVSDVVRENYRKAFEPFAAYLAASFPRVHEVLQKEVVDKHGLIFTWEGSDKSLKPLVLMAHQDVVPVEPSSVGQWVHEPFSGFIDEDKDVVWGRGASDDKGEQESAVTQSRQGY